MITAQSDKMKQKVKNLKKNHHMLMLCNLNATINLLLVQMTSYGMRSYYLTKKHKAKMNSQNQSNI